MGGGLYPVIHLPDRFSLIMNRHEPITDRGTQATILVANSRTADRRWPSSSLKPMCASDIAKIVHLKPCATPLAPLKQIQELWEDDSFPPPPPFLSRPAKPSSLPSLPTLHSLASNGMLIQHRGWMPGLISLPRSTPAMRLIAFSREAGEGEAAAPQQHKLQGGCASVRDGVNTPAPLHRSIKVGWGEQRDALRGGGRGGLPRSCCAQVSSRTGCTALLWDEHP